jgi:RimJ/RimL family protein N-acetyltransferase
MANNVQLRDVVQNDLPVFFEQQADPPANQMAAFPAREREAFMAHWQKIMVDKSGFVRTILFDGQVAGNLVCWGATDERNIGYWLGRKYWGKGIATQALAAFLVGMKERPLYAHVAKHNTGSRRVLEKCGFKLHGEDKVEEWIMKLESQA